VKQFENSQQIDYAKDYGNSYGDRERNASKVFQGKVCAHNCPDLPLEVSNSKYGVQ
jgi:hypothetical protein